jgi:hypothetical protein
MSRSAAPAELGRNGAFGQQFDERHGGVGWHHRHVAKINDGALAGGREGPAAATPDMDTLISPPPVPQDTGARCRILARARVRVMMMTSRRTGE